MAPKSKDSRIRLLEPLATDMAAFRIAVGEGNSEIGIIRAAVRVYIDQRVGKDGELLKRYEAERESLQAMKVQPLRLVTKGGEPT
jgi:hypothetical protein